MRPPRFNFAQFSAPALTQNDDERQPAPPRPDSSMVAVAVRNLRAFLTKASFSFNVDRQAAMNCVEVLEQAAHPSAPVQPQQRADDAVRDALTELVALKDLREDFARRCSGSHVSRQWVTNVSREIARREPLAWAAARAALAGHPVEPAQQEPSAHPAGLLRQGARTDGEASS